MHVVSDQTPSSRPSQCLSTHLEVLQHMLKDSRVPLAWERVTDVWSALLDNPDACADDRTVSLTWVWSGEGKMLALAG